jgi:hypothetical protein
VNFLSHPVVARLLWALPLLLLVISVSLVRAGMGQNAALTDGVLVDATLEEVYKRERSEITRGEAVLAYTPPGEAAPIERRVELPLTFLMELEQRVGETVRVRQVPGEKQLVFDSFARAQMRLTFINAAMAFVGFLVAGALVFGWNRFLAREGDPALRAYTS